MSSASSGVFQLTCSNCQQLLDLTARQAWSFDIAKDMTSISTPININVSAVPALLQLSAGQVKRIDVANGGIENVKQDFGGGFSKPIQSIYDFGHAVYQPDYGAYGALVMWGGGHAGYPGNETYIAPITSQGVQWYRVTNAFVEASAGAASQRWGGANSFPSQEPYDGWDHTKWADYGGALIPNCYFGAMPSTNHTRNSIHALPGGTGGVGRIGQFKGGNVAEEAGVFGSHTFDLGVELCPGPFSYDASKVWWKRTANHCPFGVVACDAYWFDRPNHRMGYMGWISSIAMTQFAWFDWTTDTWGPVISNAFSPGVILRVDASGLDIEHRQLLFQQYLSFDSANYPSYNGNLKLQLVLADRSGPMPWPVKNYMICAGTEPNAPAWTNSASMAYCPVDGNVYMVQPSGVYAHPYVWKLAPPQDMRLTPAQGGPTNADLMNGAWTWTRIDAEAPGGGPKLSDVLYDGIARAKYPSSAVGSESFSYHSLWWVDKLGCFLYQRGVSHNASSSSYAPPQLWKPPGVN